MSRVCDICGKSTMFGHKVSKSYRHTKKQWKPNLLKIKTQIGGTTGTLRICTQCLRSGFIAKKVKVPASEVSKSSQ